MKQNTKIQINGLPLPEHLVSLVSQGLWKCPANTDALRKLTGSNSKYDFDFLDFENMERESNPTILVEDEKIANIYWLKSSKRIGEEITDKKFLDIDKAITIALNWDEEVICLDYRTNTEKPRVVSLCTEINRFDHWRVIAPDIESFSSAIGLF